MNYENLTYEQSVEAEKRGEEVQWRGIEEPAFYSTHWRRFKCGVSNVPPVEFRRAIPDPYAELKAAHAAGKVIEVRSWGGSDWCDITDPARDHPEGPSGYRIKPDELKIEAGKLDIAIAALKDIARPHDCGCHPICRCFDDGESVRIVLNEIRSFASDALAKIAPTPYDNWDKVPAWAQWQAKQYDGTWLHGDMLPNRGDNGWFSQGWESNIPSGFTPTNFSGDWKDSLQKRP
jgi:hypothetical protein